MFQAEKGGILGLSTLTLNDKEPLTKMGSFRFIWFKANRFFSQFFNASTDAYVQLRR